MCENIGHFPKHHATRSGHQAVGTSEHNQFRSCRPSPFFVLPRRDSDGNVQSKKSDGRMVQNLQYVKKYVSVAITPCFLKFTAARLRRAARERLRDDTHSLITTIRSVVPAHTYRQSNPTHDIKTSNLTRNRIVHPTIHQQQTGHRPKCTSVTSYLTPSFLMLPSPTHIRPPAHLSTPRPNRPPLSPHGRVLCVKNTTHTSRSRRKRTRRDNQSRAT